MGGVDLWFKFFGDLLGDLYELMGVLLFDILLFEMDGWLVVKIDIEKLLVFDYCGFNGWIGDSDIYGFLVYIIGKLWLKLEGDVELW